MNIEIRYKNSTIYTVPVSVEHDSRFFDFINNSDQWQPLKQEKLKINYLFNYAANIANNSNTCIIFEHTNPEELPIYMFEKELNLNESPVVSEIRLVYFGTGVAFIELHILYGSLSVDDIIEFAYLFKKATKADGKAYNLGDKISLFSALKRILPPDKSGTKLFFANTADFKFQALSFHLLLIDDTEFDEARLSETIFLLKRSYNHDFIYDANADKSKYDMTYKPFDYTHWGGCQEGIVCISKLTGNQKTDSFITSYQYDHLTNDYRFMYLLLLNQRYSAIKYINQIAIADDKKSVEELNHKIIDLKTKYTFHVISDEMIYQNVYSQMYSIMEIDKLHCDIEENGDKLTAIQNEGAAKSEKTTERLLLAISLFSIFSAMIDSASFFDRIPIIAIQKWSTLLSFVITILIGIYYFYNKMKNLKK
ncbi:MAG: hypothetical protein J6Q94_05945 [Clostridia bacterium]|nr:hypothetical protein [Clostridia bacterium]